MGRAKEIIVKVIPANIGNDFVRKNHYSGKVVPNSKLHFGVFLDNNLHGVMQFGTPMDKSKVFNLVSTANKTKNEKWNELLELNRMAFDDYLPKNSESRAISVAIKLIKKNAPHIKWIISFSDGTASGDGTIYRATGFYLTQIRENSTIWVFPDGARIASLTLTNGGDLESRRKICQKYGAQFTSKASMKPFKDIGAYQAEGYQLRYIYLIDPTAKLNVPSIPFEAIDKIGAGMYKGEKITMQQRKVNMDQSV
jgi:hypothetical protein